MKCFPFLLCSLLRTIGRVCHSIITRTPPLLPNHESNSYSHQLQASHTFAHARTRTQEMSEKCQGYNDDGLRTVTES
ncbi:hypothetical protein FJTKL_02579 [Diaporthe vaccinii]|uniref:Secreted protein n=1 Tax=Diaporthe vaccinii TaxID=105482 RepID=A0ABR4DY01_9PEZI